MDFNKSGEFKKTFIGFGVGTGSVHVLQGVEFEVKPQEDHTFEVKPHGNVDHVVGSQKVQTKYLIYYHSARDREQHLGWELFSYREDGNEVDFTIVAVDKIYVYELLTFNDIVACEVISKWMAALKEDMDAWLDVGCKAEIWATKGLLDKANGDVFGMEIIKDQSGHSILLLEGSLLGDCDVEKNDKWSSIYAVGSQEYQMVYTRPDTSSADVGMLDGFDHGLQTDVHVFVDFGYAMGRSITVMAAYITLTEAEKEAIWIKGLAIELGFMLKIVAGIATGALLKAIPGSRFQHRDLVDLEE
nr:zinc finger, CCHC-type [Tanacetum cinerariifolium]